VDFSSRPTRLRDWKCSRLRTGKQSVDLNYLYHHHQVSIFMAENAASDESRRIHGALAADYAARIADAKCRRAPLSVD
jgi:hypothetical protein